MFIALAWDATTIGTGAGVIVAAGVVIGGVIGLVRWIRKLGAGGQRLTDALNYNTQATGKLSERFDHVDSAITGHEIRITRGEDRTTRLEGRVDRVEDRVDGMGRAAAGP